jgi:pimeloyl-ACP methyl ester carboxylesterase
LSLKTVLEIERIVGLSVLLSVFLSSGAAVAQGCPQADGVNRVDGQTECLAIQTTSKKTSKTITSGNSVKPVRNLLVYLHGDSSRGGQFDRHFKYFKPFASADTVFVGMIRPGYADSKKNASTGDKMGGGDNYTAHNVDAVAKALQALKTKYSARRLVVVGFSGGAATAGVILGRHPELIDNAVLIACPCDLTVRRQGWINQTRRSISPHEVAGAVFKTAQITAITGEADTNTSPEQVTGYITSLKERGVKASYIEVPKATHDAGILGTKLLQDAVFAHLQGKHIK